MLEHLLERINQEEFEVLSHDIKYALLEHRKWSHKIGMALVLRQPMHEQDFVADDAHSHCSFGRWMKHVLEDEQFHQQAFFNIDDVHQQLHDCAKVLLSNLAKRGEISPADLECFFQIQNEFVDMVLMIFEFSVIHKHQFDDTTKLMNRRTLDIVLTNEKHRMQRVIGSNCCIVLADIDKFKDFNDTYGHDVGDLVLAHTASLFRESIRRHDTVARFGGEEFLFMMPEMKLEEATQVIERIRLKLAESSIVHQGRELGVTASFGVTQLSPYYDIKDSIKCADLALYEAKRAGRNCTVILDVEELTKNIEVIDLANLDAKYVIQEFCLKAK
ncbi:MULTISPECIES: diguanylate cyclase [unclassified Agarivorans]|uniref:diguanylate cyclase n=1 Tax=unclassified Agarivorans TaxID=2636026 RepID=UPI003D7E9E53